jgi:dipeptidyl-peptidase-4
MAGTLLAAAAPGVGAKKAITIDTLMNPDARRSDTGSVIWAPDGQRFATVREKRLTIYDLHSKQQAPIVPMSKIEAMARPIPEATTFDWTNRRVGEEPIQWFNSGDRLLVQAAGDLFIVHLPDGAIDQLTATETGEFDPKLSPDNRHVSFRRGYDLYTIDVASRTETRLTKDGSPTLMNGRLDWVYPEELDLGTAHWWSPDSRHIAYLQFDTSKEPVFPQVDLRKSRGLLEVERYPKAGDPNAEVRVGVVDTEGGPTRWMDAGEPRDHLMARVHWFPDSTKLALMRLNRVQDKLDLLSADIANGSSRTMLHEEDKYWVNIDDSFRFLDQGKEFLWSSERSGHRHLYLYGVNGEVKRTITRGDWDVMEVAGVDEDRKLIYYLSTEDNPTERQLYVVGFDGKNKRRLTANPGTYSVSLAPTHDSMMETFSSLTQPPVRTLRKMDGTEVAVYTQADRSLLDEYQILPTEILKIKSADGQEMYARMIKPANFSPERRYPVLVAVYGGPHAQSVRNAWTGASFDQVMANKGYLVWQVDNRGSFGRGHTWESAVYRNLGAIELADQKAGIEYLKTLPYANTSRMGIYGWSYGGYMTLYSLTNAPGLFKAGAAGAPVTTWRNYDSIYTERYMGLPSENEKGYISSSPVTHAGDLTAKLLILHNVEDDNVHFQNTMQMAEALETADKQFRMVIYPQKAHGVSGPLRRHLNETMADFFDSVLMGN